LNKLKINIVSFLDPRQYRGGGEFISNKFISHLQDLGHEIYFSTVRPREINFNWESDLDILIDIYNYPTLRGGGTWRSFKDQFIKKVISKGRFIHMTNAYTDICDMPYLPCNGMNESICNHKKGEFFELFLSGKEISKCSLSDNSRKELFNKSLLNIFLSPLHQKTINESLSRIGLNLNELNEKSRILKPVVNPDLFFNQKIERDIDYLFVGVISEAKGFYNLKSKYENENIHFVGDNQVGSDLDFGTYHGKVSAQELALIYNRAKNFVYFPRWLEPQGMVVIEAALCGCNLITNDNVGALSFDFDISSGKNFENSIPELWGKIINVI
jgi:glycosyltransferase involved in cell wall biosynthesis